MRILLLLSVLLLFALGLVMIFNTTSAEVLDMSLQKSTHHALMKQLAYAMLSCFVAVFAHFIGYRSWLALSEPLLWLASGLLILTFVPGVGVCANGAHRWIRVMGISLQPSECVKVLLPLACIHGLLQIKPIERALPGDFALLAGKLLVPVALIGLEPDNGTVLICLCCLTVICFLFVVQARYWVLPICILFLGGGVAAYRLPYVSARIQVYLHPERDLHGRGHQPHQAKIAAGSGGILGKGPGRSLQKLSYLPEAQNDYIAAIYAEEFGFLGVLTMITLYMILALVGFQVAALSLSEAGFYTAAMMTFLVCIHAFLNLGVVSGLLPSTGLNLPFFSQGGSSLLASSFCLGLILSVDAETALTKAQVASTS